MLKKLASLLLISGLFISVYSFSTAEEKADGKTILESSKCLTCHGVTSMNIEGKKKDKSVDLSNTGANHKADDLKTYLKKESEYNGKKHPVAFKCEDAEFQVLVDWLLTLKK